MLLQVGFGSGLWLGSGPGVPTIRGKTIAAFNEGLTGKQSTNSPRFSYRLYSVFRATRTIWRSIEKMETKQ